MRATALVFVLSLAACGERLSTAEQSDGSLLQDTSDPGEQPLINEVRSLPFKDVVWEYKFNNRQITRMTLAGDQLFCETPEHQVIAMDRFKGVVQWIFKIDSETPLDWAPVVADGVPEEIGRLENDLRLINRQIDDKMKETGPGKETQALQKKRSEIREQLRVSAFGDNAYFISRQVLYCLDRLNGGLRWTHRLNFIPSAQPFAIRSYVFIPGADRARVWVCDVDNKGQEKTFYKSDITNRENHILNRAIYSAPSLFFSCHDGRVYSYNVDSGNLTWTYPTERALRAEPLIHVYRHSEEAKGAEAPKAKPAEGAMAAPAMAAPAMAAPAMGAPPAGQDKKPVRAAATTRFLFVGGGDNAFYALDADSGAIVWKYECAAEIKSTAIAKDSTVYVRTEEGALHAFEILPMHRDPKTNAAVGPKRNGNLRWKLPLGERFLVKGRERVYVMGPRGEIHAMDEMSGKTMGRYPTQYLNHIMSNSVDQLFYAANGAGYVFCLRESKQDY